MSRRYVKKARWNSLDQITPEVVAVVSARDNVENAADAQLELDDISADTLFLTS